jgi:hypothetical protein
MKHHAARCRRWLRVLAAGITVMTLAAAARADGELDNSFGDSGIVKVAFPGSSLGYLHDLATVGGNLEAAGFERFDPSAPCRTEYPDLFVVTLTLDGIATAPAQSYAQHAIACPMAVVIDSATGDIYVGGYDRRSVDSRASVVRFNATGTAIATYTNPSDVRYGGTRCNGQMLFDGEHTLVAACGAHGEFGTRALVPMRFSTVDDQLVPEEAFDYSFSPVGTSPRFFLRTWNALALDAGSGSIYVGGYACAQGGGGACLTSLSADHDLYVMVVSTPFVSSFGNGGFAAPLSLPGGDITALTVDDSGNVVIGGRYGEAALGFVARLAPDGSPDLTFGSAGTVQGLADTITDVRTDHDNRVYALEDSFRLLRLTADGRRDANFSAASDVQNLNGPGSAWESMRFSDSSGSAAYLVGGVSHEGEATTALIAKVLLASGHGNPGGAVATATLLQTSAMVITMGHPVTFTATVKGENPTGAVTFHDGSTMIGGPVNLTSGSASFTTDALATGDHSISASYEGDQNNAPSTSAPVTQTINAPPDNGPDPVGSTGSAGGGGSMTLSDLCAALLLAFGSLRKHSRRARQSPVLASVDWRVADRSFCRAARKCSRSHSSIALARFAAGEPARSGVSHSFAGTRNAQSSLRCKCGDLQRFFAVRSLMGFLVTVLLASCSGGDDHGPSGPGMPVGAWPHAGNLESWRPEVARSVLQIFSFPDFQFAAPLWTSRWWFAPGHDPRRRAFTRAAVRTPSPAPRPGGRSGRVRPAR